MKTTIQEKAILEKLNEVYNGFLALEQDHPSDAKDLVQAVHTIQGLIMMRVARRVDPEMFSTYRKNQGKWEMIK